MNGAVPRDFGAESVRGDPARHRQFRRFSPSVSAVEIPRTVWGPRERKGAAAALGLISRCELRLSWALSCRSGAAGVYAELVVEQCHWNRANFGRAYRLDRT